MASLNDLVTQARNPNEREDEDDPFGVNKINVAAISTTTGNNKQPLSPRTQNGFCSMFCCAAREDDTDVKVEQQKNHQQQQGGKWIQPRKPVKGVSVPRRNSDDDGRANFNSPRGGDYDNPTGTAPWKDDQLLPPQRENKKGKKCLVLDLDETLVHSSFKPVECDFVVPVEIENQVHKVYVAKRPHVDEFMKRCGELFEVVVFTASLAKYADPVLDLLDIHKVVDWRLFRESCSPFKGSYVKDMCRMGRDINSIMIVDNSPHSFAFNPENAIPCESWFNDKNDYELLEMIPKLEQLAESSVKDVKVKLKELGISGLDALKRELAGYNPAGDEEESYSESDSEYTGSSQNQSGDDVIHDEQLS